MPMLQNRAGISRSLEKKSEMLSGSRSIERFGRVRDGAACSSLMMFGRRLKRSGRAPSGSVPHAVGLAFLFPLVFPCFFPLLFVFSLLDFVRRPAPGGKERGMFISRFSSNEMFMSLKRTPRSIVFRSLFCIEGGQFYDKSNCNLNFIVVHFQRIPYMNYAPVSLLVESKIFTVFLMSSVEWESLLVARVVGGQESVYFMYHYGDAP